MARYFTISFVKNVFHFLTLLKLTVKIYGLFDTTMRFQTMRNQRMFDNDVFVYYVNHQNIHTPVACLSLCKKDEACMTATFNYTSKTCSFSEMMSMHQMPSSQRFESSSGVNSYAKFRYRGMYNIYMFAVFLLESFNAHCWLRKFTICITLQCFIKNRSNDFLRINKRIF